MGSVIKKGSYYYIQYKVPGRGWVQRSTRTRLKQVAQEKLADMEYRIARNEIGILDIEPIKFSDFYPKYMLWAEAKKRLNTIKQNRSLIENHLKPFFGEKILDRIQPKDIDQYLASRKSEGAKARSINLELLLLSVILKRAKKENHLARLPFEKIADFKLKETDSIKRRALNQAELSRLLAAADEHIRIYIAMLAYTGVRRSEAMFLSWNDIDLDQDQINIGPKPEYGFNTKSGKNRVIPLHPDLKAMLEAIPNKTGWLFNNANGKRITEFRRSFKRACKMAGLEGISPHCLRHSFASLMIANGADPKTLSEILGHATPVITMTVYAHSFDSYRRQAINRFPSIDTGAGELVQFPGQKSGEQR